jgi:hypothetical protein
MPSRFRVFSSVFLFALLVCAQLLAQSSSTSLAQHKARALKRSAGFLNGLQTPALSFVAGGPYLSGADGANAVAIADVNGDGKPDMVVANWCAYSSCTSPGTNVGVLLGKGDGTFQPAVEYASGGLFADSVAIAQLRGPGHPLDIVVANCGSSSQTNCVNTSGSGDVSVLLGNGDGTFQPAALYPLGASGATSVAVADVNGDGKPDLIVATGSSTAGLVGVLLGNGDGTFQAEATYSSGGISPLAIAVANLGNGEFDVVVANQWTDNTDTSSNVSVLTGNGNGTFNTAMPYPTGGFYPDSIAIADVNRDGKPDLVVANSSVGSDGGLGNVGVLLGNGDGTFEPEMPYDSGGYGAAAVAVADVNGDGKLDVVVANCSGSSSDCSGGAGNVGVLLGNGDGTFQTAVTYTSGSTYPFAVAVADVNGDGRPDIVAANCSSANCGQGAGYAGVLLNTTTPWPLRSVALCEQVDYFGELKADFTVWRPSTWYWYSIDGTGNLLVKDWGANGDIPIIGDYDGDGKTDVTIYRPSNGTWYIIQSSNREVVTKVWGVPGDVPVPGDYDGDGKTDTAIYRPSNMVWYIVQSSNGKVVTKQWGEPGDVLVPGDYDGDGKTDIAVYRPSNGVWYIILSSTGEVVTKQWGEPGDMPVPADYDGDGKTDIAMYRPSNGYWFVIQSSTGKVVTQQWGGQPGDKPVPRDYDGDLKADFAIWRPSNGIWYVIQSSNNQHTTHQWGDPTDIPLNTPVGQ